MEEEEYVPPPLPAVSEVLSGDGDAEAMLNSIFIDTTDTDLLEHAVMRLDQIYKSASSASSCHARGTRREKTFAKKLADVSLERLTFASIRLRKAQKSNKRKAEQGQEEPVEKKLAKMRVSEEEQKSIQHTTNDSDDSSGNKRKRSKDDCDDGSDDSDDSDDDGLDEEERRQQIKSRWLARVEAKMALAKQKKKNV
jgi:hypothetical protein